MPKIGERIVYLGIDPGVSGGIVAITLGSVIKASAMPETEAEIWELISSHSHPFGDRTFAVIEQVGGYVGGVGQPGSAMFSFGKSYGGLLMALTAARIPYATVIPQTWQSDLGVSKKKKTESKTAWKNRLKARACELFPHEKITLKTADAFLIAKYCQRLHYSPPLLASKPKSVL